jgi:hypothetical protein
MSNYPPGVTGFEPEIAGYDERDGEDVELECTHCEYAGIVPSTLVLVDAYTVVQEWTCPECEHDYSKEIDVEDLRPDAD